MAKGPKKRRRLGSLEREILYELSAGDLLYGFTFSMRSTRRMYKLARERAQYRYRRRRAEERLRAERFIEERSGRLEITDRGRSALARTLSQVRLLLDKRPAWDGRWRIVAFDIPEKYHVLRDRVRTILKRAGFVQLQQSIWIFPYACEELVNLIREESALSQHILYGVLESIEDEARIKRVFNL